MHAGYGGLAQGKGEVVARPRMLAIHDTYCFLVHIQKQKRSRVRLMFSYSMPLLRHYTRWGSILKSLRKTEEKAYQ